MVAAGAGHPRLPHPGRLARRSRSTCKLARESAAFYNAFFLDHDEGGVYFNVLANGIPYLVGTERLKGSHSMSGYHSIELCYLAAVYTNLLVTKQPLDLHFKPKPGAFPDDILRVAPDILPPGSIKIESVWSTASRYTDFDAEKLTVKLPQADGQVKIVVRIAPTEGLTHFTAHCKVDKNVATLTLAGDADHMALPTLQAKLQEVVAAQPETLVIRMKELKTLTPGAIRALIFGKQKLNTDADVQVIGASQTVKDA